MYQTSAYFVSKTLCDIIPMRIIPPIILGSIIYWMVGLHSGIFHFLYFLEVLILVSLSAGSLCLAIGSSTPSLAFGNLITVLILLFYLLFGGFLVNKLSMPNFVRWLKWISFFNYGFEILMINELDGLKIRFNPKGYDINPVIVNGSAFLIQFDMDKERFYFDQIILILMIILYLLISYLLLRFLIKEKR